MTSITNYSIRIDSLRQALRTADYLIIGAGSGLTTAAGLDYAGDDFRSEGDRAIGVLVQLDIRRIILAHGTYLLIQNLL